MQGRGGNCIELCTMPGYVSRSYGSYERIMHVKIVHKLTPMIVYPSDQIIFSSFGRGGYSQIWLSKQIFILRNMALTFINYNLISLMNLLSISL